VRLVWISRIHLIFLQNYLKVSQRRPLQLN